MSIVIAESQTMDSKSDCINLWGRLRLLVATVILCAYTSILTANPVIDQNEATHKKPARDYILIGHPNPSTGPLTGFGEATPWADDRLINFINSQGGIYIKEYGKKLPVKVKIVDTESDPGKAISITTNLILRDKVDMIVVAHTPDTVNPVTAVCEKYNVPCVSDDTPVESWLANGPYKWSYHSFWTLDSLSELFINVWDEYAGQTNKVVGCLWPDDPDGRAWEGIFNKKLTAQNYTIVNYSGFPHMTNDFSPAINLFKSKHVDIITGPLLFPDFVTFWRQCHKMNYVPKIATMGKSLLFPTDVKDMENDQPEGLTNELWWSPYHPYTSKLTGETCKQLCDAWSKETGKQWTMTLGFSYAPFEVAFDALMRAQSLDKEEIRKAIGTTDLDTIIGHIKYNSEHYCQTPLVLGQWTNQKNGQWELKIVYNKQYPQIPLNGKMTFPIPDNTSRGVFK